MKSVFCEFSEWKWGQHGSQKRRNPTASLHGVTTQKNSTWIFTVVKIWNLAFFPSFQIKSINSLLWSRSFPLLVFLRSVPYIISLSWIRMFICTFSDADKPWMQNFPSRSPWVSKNSRCVEPFQRGRERLICRPHVMRRMYTRLWIFVALKASLIFETTQRLSILKWTPPHQSGGLQAEPQHGTPDVG